MASFLKNILGGEKEKQKPLASGDDAGFADFANAPPEPQPASISPVIPTLRSAASSQPTLTPLIPYTKWYRVWERTKVSDFYQEMVVAPFILLVLLIHVFGLRKNRSKAREWARHHAPPLEFEYASVGFNGKAKLEDEETDADKIIKEQKADEFVSYATGRNNVAFTDFKLTLSKRYNPFVIFGEHLVSLVFDSIPVTVERMEATTYPFDNREAALVPRRKDVPEPKSPNSSYDGFVFAVIHKKMLRRLREDRYDLSLTVTKDHAKLPAWTTVLSENSEITETILTPELIGSIELAGDFFEALIITDQPLERPSKLNDTVPRKRMSLSLRLPSNKQDYVKTMPLFANYLRLPDFLVQNAHFRPEATRKIKATRDAEINRIKKEDDDVQAEERKTKLDKDKKEKREALLQSMSATEQRKYLDKEREKEMRRGNKKRTMRA